MRIFKHPIKKLTLISAFGGGYVLGAKAGRERYEQILQKFNQVKADPRVQNVADKVSEDPRVQDVAAKAQAVFKDTKSAVEPEGDHEAADDSTGDSTSESKSATAAPVPTPPPAPKPQSDSNQPGVHRLLADEHVDEPDEVVYSSGPDVVVQPLVDGERDTV